MRPRKNEKTISSENPLRVDDGQRMSEAAVPDMQFWRRPWHRGHVEGRYLPLSFFHLFLRAGSDLRMRLTLRTAPSFSFSWPKPRG